MSSSGDVEYDYLSRFEQLKAVEVQKDELISELLDRLDVVERERDVIKQDLEIQQDARRRLQEDVAKFTDLERTINQGRLVVVLIDADADIYLFHERFIIRGEKGGQEAAEELMVKTRQYLQTVVKDASVIEIVVKAYANFNGLIHPWERTDVLDVYYANPNCQHIILGCYHDQGYIPFLRKFHQAQSATGKITLLKAGPPVIGLDNLGFKTTTDFNSIFATATSNLFPTSPSITTSFSTVNPERLAPITYDSNGQRIDKVLSVEKTLLARMKRLNLCSRYYLRGVCSGCNYSHDYPRPLSLEEYDAV